MRGLRDAVFTAVSDSWWLIAALCAVVVVTGGGSHPPPRRVVVYGISRDAVATNEAAYPIVLRHTDSDLLDVCNQGTTPLLGQLQWGGSDQSITTLLPSGSCCSVASVGQDLEVVVLGEPCNVSADCDDADETTLNVCTSIGRIAVCRYVTAVSTNGTDSDGDGLDDAYDGCPFDPGKFDPGVCGCGQLDLDVDHDCVMDCIDACPDNPLQSRPPCDLCPDDPLKIIPGRCGCGNADSPADLDQDCDVDLIDYGVFQLELTGPRVVPQ